jgi:hypothetical protein
VDAGQDGVDAGVGGDLVDEGGELRVAACAWERRKADQVVACRSGAGARPSCLRISQMVEGAIVMPRVVSSPWIR